MGHFKDISIQKHNEGAEETSELGLQPDENILESYDIWRENEIRN